MTPHRCAQDTAPRGVAGQPGANTIGSMLFGRGMVMKGAIKIAVAEARIDDPGAMASFFAPIPNNGELAALLAKKEPLNTRAYDDETQTARFVISDGNVALCFAVSDITIDQAELITIACEESNEWGAASFPEAASRALGEPVGRLPE
jgi:hypothetical protein